jgi:hypothetical protein
MINRHALETGVEAKARTFSVVSHLSAMLFAHPRRGSLDMRRRLPGRLVGLAAMLRSLPTALTRVLKLSSAGADG